MFYIKMTILPPEEDPVSPTGQLNRSLDSFYVTDSPLSVTNVAQMADSLLSVTNIAEMAMFYLKLIFT